MEEKVVTDFAIFCKLHCFLFANMGRIESTGIYCDGLLSDLSILGFSDRSDLAKRAYHVAWTSWYANLLRYGEYYSISSKLRKRWRRRLEEWKVVWYIGITRICDRYGSCCSSKSELKRLSCSCSWISFHCDWILNDIDLHHSWSTDKLGASFDRIFFKGVGDGIWRCASRWYDSCAQYTGVLKG